MLVFIKFQIWKTYKINFFILFLNILIRLKNKGKYANNEEVGYYIDKINLRKKSDSENE